MDESARLAALEHLVIALIKENSLRAGFPPGSVFKAAAGSIMGSNGPGGPKEKSAAMEALENIQLTAGFKI
ncbi:hypothetical protein [Pseudomonas sp. fls2-241-R2A-110]|uniref:hypothetical protein n=1 Tax=Pseudomonas sp. fls2-241-R2A-110 TaxID=3040311 RepID=UPI0025538336|nr:hypothetical protein [Pseudomonas sp. fls2-241-R2A-110]